MRKYLLELVINLTSGRYNSNCTLVEIELERLQGAFWTLLPGGSFLSFSLASSSCVLSTCSRSKHPLSLQLQHRDIVT
jgi:hypothetical protein